LIQKNKMSSFGTCFRCIYIVSLMAVHDTSPDSTTAKAAGPVRAAQSGGFVAGERLAM
jgi:hypothetical protein